MASRAPYHVLDRYPMEYQPPRTSTSTGEDYLQNNKCPQRLFRPQRLHMAPMSHGARVLSTCELPREAETGFLYNRKKKRFLEIKKDSALRIDEGVEMPQK